MAWFPKKSAPTAEPSPAITEKAFLELVAKFLVQRFKKNPQEAVDLVKEYWDVDVHGDTQWGEWGVKRIYQRALAHPGMTSYPFGKRPLQGVESYAYEAAVGITTREFTKRSRWFRQLVWQVEGRLGGDGWKEEEIRSLIQAATPIFLQAIKTGSDVENSKDIIAMMYAQYGHALPKHVAATIARRDQETADRMTKNLEQQWAERAQREGKTLKD